jgi:hypothetical protein
LDDAGATVTCGGDAERPASAFGIPGRASQIAAVLSLIGADSDENGIAFETDRHEQLVEALGLPRSAVGAGYEYLSAGEYPVGYAAGDFERIGGAE